MREGEMDIPPLHDFFPATELMGGFGVGEG
jgi:hypothetical protein